MNNSSKDLYGFETPAPGFRKVSFCALLGVLAQIALKALRG